MLELVEEIRRLIQLDPDWEKVVDEKVISIPVGSLVEHIIYSDNIATQCQASSRVGFPRYTKTWEEYLRALIKAIIIVTLNLDRLE